MNDELDVKLTENHYSFQKKEWIASRLFWVLMGMIILAASLGLFGKGLLSNKTFCSNGVQVKYNKFLRVEKTTELKIQVDNLGADGKILLNNNYLEKVRIDQVIPEPNSVGIHGGKLVYTFNSVQNGFITFYLLPVEMGSVKLEVTIKGNRMSFDQFIYF